VGKSKVLLTVPSHCFGLSSPLLHQKASQGGIPSSPPPPPTAFFEQLPPPLVSKTNSTLASIWRVIGIFRLLSIYKWTQRLSVCLCVCVCVYVSHAFRHFSSDRLANRLFLFLSTRRISRHLTFPKFPPLAAPRGSKTVRNGHFLAFPRYVPRVDATAARHGSTTAARPERCMLLR